MKIAVVGPGAIGCLFAGLLAEAGNDVRMLDKNDERARMISKQGIRIDDHNGSRVIRVRISADPEAVGCSDLVFLCVKSYDIDLAVRHALPLMAKETIVAPLANGSGNAEKIARFISAPKIVCGITSHGSTKLGFGHVRHAGTGPTIIAAFLRDERKRAELTAEVLSASKMEARVSDDMEQIVWSKLIISAAINPLTAMLNMANGQLLENGEARKTMRAAALEAESVARAKGIVLSYADTTEEVERVCRDTMNNISSMLQDVRDGKRTEIEAITGVIVQEARAAGIEVPVNEMLLARVREIEKNNI